VSTTLLVARTRLRVMIRETTPNQWSNTRLNDLLQDSDWETYKKLGRIRNAGYGELEEDITLAADATTFSLTPGSNPTALTKNLKGIIGIDLVNSAGENVPCGELQSEDEHFFRTTNATVASGDVPPLYRLRRPSILFLPPASVARTLRVRYRPRTTAFADDTATLDVDDDYVPYVCTRAAIFAKLDLGETDPMLNQAMQLLEDELFADLAHMSGEGRTQIVKRVDDSYQL